MTVYIRKPKYEATPIVPPKEGYDKDAYLVRYDERIPFDDRVPGLAEQLLNELDHILDGFCTLIYHNPNFVAEDQPIERMEPRRLNPLNDKFYRKIPIILSDETPVDHVPVTPEYQLEKIKKAYENQDNSNRDEEVLDILKIKRLSMRIEGKYCQGGLHSDEFDYPADAPYIVIYYKNIEYNPDEPREYYERLALVLAHECAHYYHHLQIGDAQFNKRGKYVEKVKESIADFFSVWYGIWSDRYSYDYIRTDVAEKRHDEWTKNLVLDWPYSYALYFIPDHHTFFVDLSNSDRDVAMQKYIDVFFSKTMIKAYSLLMR